MSTRTLVSTLLLTAATLAGTYLFFFQLSQLFVVTFGAILMAIALDVPTTLLQHRLHVPRIVALLLVTLLLLGFWAALGAWIGPQISRQLDELQQQVRLAFSNLRSWLDTTEPFRSLQRLTPQPTDVAPPAAELLQRTQRVLVGGVGAIVDVFIVVLVGYFLAATPRRYTHGLLLLLPKDTRERGQLLLNATARALRWWLVARLLLMLFIGVLFGLGLWILGVPLVLPLAVLAALFNFIPYLGPLLAYIPAVAVGLLESPKTALYVTVLYIVIQLTESNLAEPLIEARTVTLPPGLIVLAQILSVLWLGFVGVLFATPLLITVVVAIQVLYVRHVLGEDIPVAGQH